MGPLLGNCPFLPSISLSLVHIIWLFIPSVKICAQLYLPHMTINIYDCLAFGLGSALLFSNSHTFATGLISSWVFLLTDQHPKFKTPFLPGLCYPFWKTAGWITWPVPHYFLSQLLAFYFSLWEKRLISQFKYTQSLLRNNFYCSLNNHIFSPLLPVYQNNVSLLTCSSKERQTKNIVLQSLSLLFPLTSKFVESSIYSSY